MALLDVNALVALAWDSHVHHTVIRRWFADNAEHGWATCPVTESGFGRVSSNPRVLPSAIGTAAARTVLAQLRSAGAHRFLSDDVSMVDADVPATSGHRRVTDAHLVTLARRNGVRVVTFDAGLADLGGHRDVELLKLLQGSQPAAPGAVEPRSPVPPDGYAEPLPPGVIRPVS